MAHMDNTIDYDYLKERLDNAKENEGKRLEEARRRRNVAAFTDFATNLLSLAAYMKGARYNVGTSHLSVQQPLYSQAKENYARAIRDYKGRIAGTSLFKNVATGRSAAVQRHVPFIGSTADWPARPFLKGACDAPINDFKSTNNRKNNSL